jgi:CCR4-NOT transcriptional regulation complex NOT5 subunit
LSDVDRSDLEAAYQELAAARPTGQLPATGCLEGEYDPANGDAICLQEGSSCIDRGRNGREVRFDSSEAVMRLLKRHTDEPEADRAETDVPVVEEAAVDTEPAVETDADDPVVEEAAVDTEPAIETDADDPAVEEAAVDTEAVKTEPEDTDTDEPVDEPTAIVPAR